MKATRQRKDFLKKVTTHLMQVPGPSFVRSCATTGGRSKRSKKSKKEERKRKNSKKATLIANLGFPGGNVHCGKPTPDVRLHKAVKRRGEERRNKPLAPLRTRAFAITIWKETTKESGTTTPKK